MTHFWRVVQHRNIILHSSVRSRRASPRSSMQSSAMISPRPRWRLRRHPSQSSVVPKRITSRCHSILLRSGIVCGRVRRNHVPRSLLRNTMRSTQIRKRETGLDRITKRPLAPREKNWKLRLHAGHPRSLRHTTLLRKWLLDWRTLTCPMGLS